MAWQCLDEFCTYQLYTLSDTFKELVTYTLQYFLELTAGFYIMAILASIAGFILYLFWYTNKLGRGNYT